MDTLITLATYILGFLAVMLTIGFVVWLFVARHIWSEYKKSRDEFNRMGERIKASRGTYEEPRASGSGVRGNTRANMHKIHL